MLNRVKGALDFLITARFGVDYNSIHGDLQVDSFGVPHPLEVNRNQACLTDHIESHHNFVFSNQKFILFCKGSA